MAEDNKKKISELQQATSFSGSEKVPLAVSGSNRSAELAALKEYFKDNNLVVFAEIVDADVTVSNSPLTPEDGAVIGVVYLSKKQAFVERKTVSGVSSYSNQYARRTDYMDGASVREDKIFYCQADKKIYAYSEGKLECISSDFVIEEGSITEDKLSPEVAGKLSTGLAKDIVFTPTQDLQSNNVQGALETLDSGKLGKKDIVQELGESEDKVLSQKGVNSALTNLKATLSGRFIEHIYKPDYTPNLSKLTPGDYFTTDLFECLLVNFPKDKSGAPIDLFTRTDIHRKQIVYKGDNIFSLIDTGELANFIKLPINFLSKSISSKGLSFKAFIGDNRFPFEYSLIYEESRAESGVLNAYWSSTVVYYDMKDKTVKSKSYSTAVDNPGNYGFDGIDTSSQCYIAILKNGPGGTRLVNSYFNWQVQQSAEETLTKSNFLLENANEYTLNISRVEDILGSSVFMNVLYAKHDPIELSKFSNAYWVISINDVGEKTFNNILFNGTPISYTFEKTGVYIISINSTGEEYKIENFPNYIGAHWDGVLFAGPLILGVGTYIHFRDHALGYINNIPTEIIGVSKEKTRIITVSDYGYDASPRLLPIRANVKNISFYNSGFHPQGNVVKVEDCKYEYDSLLTSGSWYMTIFEKEEGSFVVKNTEFIAHGNIFAFFYLSANYIEIDGCTFKAQYSSHPIRINECSGYCSIKGNYVENGKTGIFLGSTRRSIIKNVIIESNTVKNCVEESISLDCFGNNTGLCPVISKSYVDSVTLDENARTTTINLRYLYYAKSVTGGYTSDIVDASFFNPEKFIFIVVNGEHKFSIFEPISAEQITYTGDSGERTTYRVVVKGYLPNLMPGDEVGFYSGFFNCTIKGNLVENAGQTKASPGHGVSLWGGGYGCKIENNTLIGCNNGIQMNGFNSFGVYTPAMFNYSLYNNIQGNTIRDCAKALKVGAVYASTAYPYLKDAFIKIYGNTISRCGVSDITDTDNLLFSNNIVEYSDIKFTRCNNKYIENNLVVESEFTEV